MTTWHFMSAPPRAVFLSYASQDADAAKTIASALRAAKIAVWLDQSELRGGDAWDARIQRQVAACTLFVPIISVHTQGRREGYFRFEWRMADERMRRMALGTPFLVPVAFDNIAERGALVPRSFLDVHWTRLSRDKKVRADLVHHLQALLVQGTLRGETLLHVPRPSHTSEPSPMADRSIVMPLAPSVTREPVDVAVRSKLTVPLRGTTRTNPFEPMNPAIRRYSWGFGALLIAGVLAAIAGILWALSHR
jgi:hypothetical protein